MRALVSRFHCCLFVVGITLVGCQRPSIEKNQAPTLDVERAIKVLASVESDDSASPDFTVGEPQRFANLTVFPVLSGSLLETDRFITLDEGLKTGAVEIRELESSSDSDDPFSAILQSDAICPIEEEASAPDSSPTDTAKDDQSAEPSSQDAATFEDIVELIEDQDEDPFGDDTQGFDSARVNTVCVINRSDRPLYLMPGELIIGGKQDRSIARETIVLPDGKPTEVAVFCVEHGRWQRRASAETEMLVDQSRQIYPVADNVFAANGSGVGQRASEGKFVASFGGLSTKARRTVQEDADQRQVWEEVAVQNEALGIGEKTASGTFAKNYSDEQVARQLEPYLAALHEPIAKQDRIVGVMIAVNGEMQSVDVFESTPLFRKLWPKLLKSFALDAISAASDEELDAGVSLAEARRCFAEMNAGQADQIAAESGAVLARRSSGETVGFSFHEEGDGNASGAAGGFGFGGAVHGAGYY